MFRNMAIHMIRLPIRSMCAWLKTSRGLTASVIGLCRQSVTITHIYSDDIPMVRVYIDVHAGRELNLGDAVCFTAEAVNCGDNPQYQWQFSEDNRNWIDVTGATSPQLNIILTDSNVKGYWRVGVTITD